MKPENSLKKPTLKEKVEMYETFLHKINIFVISCNPHGIKELVENADNWSYAHRRGEFLTDKQREKIINNAFWKLLNTPKTDTMVKEQQKAWTKNNERRTKMGSVSQTH